MYAPSSLLFTASALLAIATAQTAPGFPIQVSQQLSVAYGGIAVDGKLVPQDDTANPPSNISTPVFNAAGANGPDLGVLLMVDKDVPVNGSRVQLIHWVATDVKVAPASYGSTQRALTIDSAPVPYLQPMPPAGDQPHAYSFIFYAQPADFSIPDKYANLSAAIPNRIGFNVVQFVKDLKLDAPLAGNYMLVQNTTAITSTMSFPPITPNPTASATASGKASATGKPTMTTGSMKSMPTSIKAMATSTRAMNGTRPMTPTASAPAMFTGRATAFVLESRSGWAASLMALLTGVVAFAL